MGDTRSLDSSSGGPRSANGGGTVQSETLNPSRDILRDV